MKFVKNYRENDSLRKSFNALAEETFGGLSFENWYQNGFWQDKYIPYSMVENDTVVANVSVNITNIFQDGIIKHYIQLGTVMTDAAYRNRGLIRQIMAEIDKDFADKTDGIFLFANDSVLSFYPKFGFAEAKEYQYSKNVEIIQNKTVSQIPMNSKSDWEKLVQAIEYNQFHGRFDMINNSSLIMFYVTSFMQENVYYDSKNNAYVIAEVDDDCLFIHNVFADTEIELDKVINSFGKEIKRVVLGFTPKDNEGYIASELKEDDTTLFIRGFSLENQTVMFPTLSHA